MTGALKGLGNDVFEQLTSWVSEGASWLMGQVVKAIDASTTPRLDTEGWLRPIARASSCAVATPDRRKTASIAAESASKSIMAGLPDILRNIMNYNTFYLSCCLIRSFNGETMN